jgi:hypothetical protein
VLGEVLTERHAAKSAMAELSYESTANGPWAGFPVHGIPDAKGFESICNSSGGRNVAFDDGDHYYIVGSNGAADQPMRSHAARWPPQRRRSITASTAGRAFASHPPYGRASARGESRWRSKALTASPGPGE